MQLSARVGSHPMEDLRIRIHNSICTQRGLVVAEAVVEAVAPGC